MGNLRTISQSVGAGNIASQGPNAATIILAPNAGFSWKVGQVTMICPTFQYGIMFGYVYIGTLENPIFICSTTSGALDAADGDPPIYVSPSQQLIVQWAWASSTKFSTTMPQFYVWVETFEERP